MFGNKLFNILAKSPLKPVQKHMGKIVACAACLEPLVEHVQNNDWEQAELVLKELIQLEDEADALMKDIRIHLPKSLFMPVSRSELIGLLTNQDKIANKAKHIALLITQRKISFPEELKLDYKDLVKSAFQTINQAKKAIYEIDELIETGFKGREVNIVAEMIDRLDVLEDENDKIQLKLRNSLFGLESYLPPVDVIFLYRLIDSTSELADRAQQVGQRLEVLIA